MKNILKSYTDVLVLGSGPAGFAAAYTAAKNGAEVVLVEQCGDVGGISTSGLMSHWTGDCDSPLYHEILNRSAKNNDFDVHNITGSGLDETGVQKHFTQNKGYTIPYGCLLPEKKERLLLCGRNISGTHIAHSNFRAMPICVGTGEAAGAAAAIAVKNNCLLKDIDAKEIQRTVGI